MKLLCFALILLMIYACKSTLFTTAKSPHAEYAESLKKAELDSTALGKAWHSAATKSLTQPLSITLPYRETGYFDAVHASAIGYKFNLKRGELLRVHLTRKPEATFQLFMELWSTRDGKMPSLEESPDPTVSQFSFESKRDGHYIIRLQPELLASGEYTIVIEAGPSLAFPVLEKANPKISSLWGAPRDGGERTHEGIDIFAARRTPLLAAAPGVVSSVRENNLGGKVIFIRARERGYSLYYAHLDSQLVSAGQKVEVGDVIGLMGNTGNAKNTAPHLHFGIYTSDGPVDPLPFVQKRSDKPAAITVPLQQLNAYVRTTSASRIYSNYSSDPITISKLEANTLMRVKGAVSGYYRIELPDGREGFVAGNGTATTTPLRTVVLKTAQALRDKPDQDAAIKKMIAVSEKIQVLANFNNYSYVESAGVRGWMRTTDIN